MSHALPVLLLSLVFLFGSGEGDSKTKQRIVHRIHEVRTQIGHVKADSVKLREDIRQFDAACSKEIKAKTVAMNKLVTEGYKQYVNIEELYRTLTKTHTEDDKLTQVSRNIEKTRLGIKTMNLEMEIFEKGRKYGMTQKCLELQGMANSTGSLSFRAATLRSGMQINETVVEETAQTLVETDLEVVQLEHSGLKLQLMNAKSECKRKEKELQTMTDIIVKRDKKRKETIELLKKKLAEKKQKIAELKRTQKAREEELERGKKQAKTILERYEKYAVDRICYKKVLNDVKRLVSPSR